MKTRIIILGLIVLVVIGCRRKPADDYEYYEPEKKDTTTVVADTIDKKVEVKKIEKRPEVLSVNVDDPYFIVVASYTVEDFANAKKRELEKQGLKPAVIMTNDDGWYKLAVQSFESYSDAKEALPALIKKEGIFSEAVIVYKK
ncbi:MAG: SPOR domain-containing protein [Prolixibacteraceae bacterium]|jgi:cell division protein FtsN|nr:SPOR domain-containing protein [Prolixibacteraceae bacterium]